MKWPQETQNNADDAGMISCVTFKDKQKIWKKYRVIVLLSLKTVFIFLHILTFVESFTSVKLL